MWMSAGILHVEEMQGVSMKLEAINASAHLEPRVIHTSLAVLDQHQLEDQNVPRMKTALASSPVKDRDASTLAQACHVGTMLFVFLKLMLPGASAKVDSRRMPVASVCLSA